MKLLVHSDSDTPLYLQLFLQIEEQILSGALQAEQCLPSIRLVARELEISVLPVRAAYDLLEERGYIYTVQGKGCFVAQLPSLETTRHAAASADITAAIDRCKKLGLSVDEIIELVKQLY